MTAGTLGANAYGPVEFKDLSNFNIFSGQEDFLGGKVGKTPEAGHTMVALFNVKIGEEDRPLVVVVLDSANEGADVAALKEAVVQAYGNR
jgi:D-alanyl-D-alanine carboxypeptidase